jgi:sigma-B regulation protein RsbU (phosphoserine phosphatase)
VATTPHSSVQRPSLLARLQQFWQRVTEGLAVSQLWSQFETETRSSYRLYSRDVQAKTPEGLTTRGRRLHVLKEFFWAVLEKLSPARRVLLLLALIMLMGPWDDLRYQDSSGGLHGIQFNSQFWAGLLLFFF